MAIYETTKKWSITMLFDMLEEQTGIIKSLPKDKASLRRLMGLGVRANAKFNVLSIQPRGVVISMNQNRVAIDPDIAKKIEVEAE